jgi:hypothetical protein
MRAPLLPVVSLLLLPASVFSQEVAAIDPAEVVAPQVGQNKETDAKQSYLVELVEFRLGDAPSAALSAEEILDRLNRSADDDSVEVIQTFHLSAVAGHESMANVGLQAAITSGVQFMQPRGGPIPPIRNLEQVHLGTALMVTARPAGDKIRISVRYEASRIDGERPEDGPPDIVSITLQSQLLVTSGQRILLGGARGAPSSYATIIVTER